MRIFMRVVTVFYAAAAGSLFALALGASDVWVRMACGAGMGLMVLFAAQSFTAERDLTRQSLGRDE